MTAPSYPPGWWLTIPDICADLKIAPADWHDWASQGLAPTPEYGADGIGRVHRADFEAWCDSLPTDGGGAA